MTGLKRGLRGSWVNCLPWKCPGEVEDYTVDVWKYSLLDCEKNGELKVQSY